MSVFIVIVMILACFMILTALSNEATQGLGILLLLFAVLGLIEMGSDGKLPLLTYFATGFKAVHDYIISSR